MAKKYTSYDEYLQQAYEEWAEIYAERYAKNKEQQGQEK